MAALEKKMMASNEQILSNQEKILSRHSALEKEVKAVLDLSHALSTKVDLLISSPKIDLGSIKEELKVIIANQQKIVENQAALPAIRAKQEVIVSNQGKLDEIRGNQKDIIANQDKIIGNQGTIILKIAA